ncbi:FAD-dependent monooxygenase [Streptomyces griseorubiginosus]|uniref:FAD-dependent monooxygenase n=1 Tax=Streptomyces griseorubiginosus TaxID=67304 RepID=UPI00368452EE
MSRVLPDRVPVLVVGAGPVGLALACELGWRGVGTLVLDAGDGSIVFPAGEHIFSRTMEHLRRWGIADEARQLGWPPRGYRGGVAFVTSVTGHVLATLEPGSRSPIDEVTPERPMVQAKFRFDPLLRRHAESYESVTVAHRHEVTGFEQDADGVTVQVRDLDGGRDLRIRADHLVSCEGARSMVRRRLGIQYEGEFAQGHNFAVYFRSAGLRTLLQRHGLVGATQIQTNVSPLRPYLTVVDGKELWRCSIYYDGGSDPDPREVVWQAVGSEVDVEVIRCQPWTGHLVVADRYGVGRVFLAGDAAHLRWPKGGFGANTGIGDAVDLGWKLAAVHAGWGGPGLLAGYEPERRPIALRNGRWAAENWAADQKVPSGPLLEADTPEGVEARAHAAEVITRERLKEYLTVGVQLGYRYDASPLCHYDEAVAPEDRSDIYVPSTCAGARAPHAWLPDGSSTLDHFGRGFTVVRSGSKPGLDPLLDAARVRAVPLSVVDVDDPETALLYQEALVLVRPDGHVAWRGPVLPADVESLLDLVRGAAPAPAPAQ